MFGRVLFSFIIVTLLSFNVQEIDTATKKIQVTGKAQNAKSGATLVMQDESVYYLHGVRHWPEQFSDKQVMVTGRLKLVTNEKRETDSVIRAVWTGTRKYIINPKWSLAE